MLGLLISGFGQKDVMKSYHRGTASQRRSNCWSERKITTRCRLFFWVFQD